MEEVNKSREKFRKQMDMQQTEEDLRKVRVRIAELDIMLRKYQQEFIRAEMNLKFAEEEIKKLKTREFDLNQTFVRQKKDLLSAMTGSGAGSGF